MPATLFGPSSFVVSVYFALFPKRTASAGKNSRWRRKMHWQELKFPASGMK